MASESGYLSTAIAMRVLTKMIASKAKAYSGGARATHTRVIGSRTSAVAMAR